MADRIARAAAAHPSKDEGDLDIFEKALGRDGAIEVARLAMAGPFIYGLGRNVKRALQKARRNKPVFLEAGQATANSSAATGVLGATRPEARRKK